MAIHSESLKQLDATSPRRAWLRQGPLRLMLGLLLFKVAYLGLLSTALWLWDSFDTDKFWNMMARWPRHGSPVFASHFATWDAAHYLYLSEVGYQRGVPSCAFYPMWPLLVRWSAPLFGGSHVVAGVVLANLLSLGAWALFHRLVVARWGEGAAKWSLIFLIAFPGSLFLQFNYSEALFLSLTLVLWWALTQQKKAFACGAAFLLPLTRGPGAFAVLPIAWHTLVPTLNRYLKDSARKEPERTGRDLSSGVLRVRCELRSGVLTFVGKFLPEWLASGGGLVLVPVAGWSLYLTLMWFWTGNPLEGMHAQKYWGVHSIGNLWNLPKFLVGFFTPTKWHEFRGSFLDRSMFILLLYSLPVLWRLDKRLMVWLYVLGVLPAMSGTFTSFTRFASCAFPMFIALGSSLHRRKWRWPLLVAFIVLQIVLVWQFANFRWAG